MDTKTYEFTSHGDYWALRHSDEEAFKAALHEDILGREDELEEFLEPYCTNFREEYSSESLCCTWDDALTLGDDNTGEATLEFEGYIHSGCRDARGTVDHQTTVRFRLDLVKRTVTLTFLYPPEREPDEP